MKRTYSYAAYLISTVFVLVYVSAAQVATGTPTFNSFGGGPFDVVNLGNLNVHFSVPVFQRRGRGMPFSYNLSYDSSIWTPVTSGGVTTWTPVGGWGWLSQTDGVTGYIPSPKVTTSNQYPCEGGGYGHLIISTYPGFVDPLGTFHGVSHLTSTVDTCGGDSGSTGTASDGSGWTVTVPDGIVSSRSGVTWDVPIGSHSGAGKATDTNGNQISTTNGTTFYDTLSASVAVLTISGNAPNPVNYTYTSPQNTQVSYTMNYLSYTVQTNFGVSNTNGPIAEYGRLANSLVSSIHLPDGNSYTFTYEKTSGTCTPLSGTYQTNCVTGRIASVTLPTGGTITYSYTGGPNNTGIYARDSRRLRIGPNTMTWRMRPTAKTTTAPGRRTWLSPTRIRTLLAAAGRRTYTIS